MSEELESLEARLRRDQLAREQIVRDLDTNMLVEAGAGSGKTTSLVNRMAALVARGTPVERIAAVTFTRKAANELRERFQIELERRARAKPAHDEETRRYDRALRDSSRAFLGTIHAFCGRLLREQPFEAGLDPRFTEVSEEDWSELQRNFWRRWTERAKRDDDAGLAALRRVGIDVRVLFDGFGVMVSYADVAFPTADVPLPDIRACLARLGALLARTRAAMPATEPDGGWDPLMTLVRTFEFHRSLDDWNDVGRLCSRLERIADSHCEITQKRWSADKEGKAVAKALAQEWSDFVTNDVAAIVALWREHRYPIVIHFLERAVAAFERERHVTGQLGFEDLLLLSARLLRDNPAMRAELGARYAHLLVDEFQDTDPVQAEVCFLLASPPSEGNDWRRVTPRPGSLFVVGDPKQSIYRFRRADIQIYELVKRRLSECGVTLALTRNFRSVKPIEELVNAHFSGAFPSVATAIQAQFTPMETSRAPVLQNGIFRYEVAPEERNKDALYEEDAAIVASWIADRVARGEKRPADFLVLTGKKDQVAYYARALAERNVPVTTKGASLPQEYELRELLVLLRALADPENAIAVAAALEGLFFGASPADLFAAHRGGVFFVVTHAPTDAATGVGGALHAMHEWWKLSQRQPSDVLLERILDDTGLLAYAASQSLGDARAGALIHLVEALRGSDAGSGTGIVDAIDRLELLLRAEASDAPLRPGRADAALVMNVHQAKGLEADVVMLVAPQDLYKFKPAAHIERRDDGNATGSIMICVKEGNQTRIVAQPPGWLEMQAEEQRFVDAERGRLLYVATTRACNELVVAQKASGVDSSAWASLAPVLATQARLLAPIVTLAPGRRQTMRTPDSVRDAIAATNARRRNTASPTLQIATVTESVKAEREARRSYDLPSEGLGVAWGRAVHRVIEGLARGRSGEGLRAFAGAVADDEQLSVSDGRALGDLAEKIRLSDAWRRLCAAGAIQPELGIMRCQRDDGRDVLTEGVIDAASLAAGDWTIVDWKTDDVGGGEWSARSAKYLRQVEEYGAMITTLLGDTVSATVERVLRGT